MNPDAGFSSGGAAVGFVPVLPGGAAGGERAPFLRLLFLLLLLSGAAGCRGGAGAAAAGREPRRSGAERS